MPLLRQIGAASVNSHTVKVKVDMKDADALRAAILAMSGKWLGQGNHKLFSSHATGHGFTLPGWRYPIVLDSAGELHYDDYSGSWGNVADLETLRAAYAFTKTETAARALGWQTERTAEGSLRVYHPSGGWLDVSPGLVCDATGFVGGACHEVREQLGLPTAEAPVNKNEHEHHAAQIELPGQ